MFIKLYALSFSTPGLLSLPINISFYSNFGACFRHFVLVFFMKMIIMKMIYLAAAVAHFVRTTVK